MFVIFDSQGPYGEPQDTAQEATRLCERYNRIAAEPLKPFFYRRYVLPHNEGELIRKQEEEIAAFARGHAGR